MDKRYTYRVRPSFGKLTELLLEFQFNGSNPEFVQDLTKALESIHPQIISSEDVWMNDEFLLTFSSERGDFHLSMDTWDNAFILANDNASCISAIDNELANNPYFEKVG